MDHAPDTCRTIDVALVGLYEKIDRVPEDSIESRLKLERMIEVLEAEITDRAARMLARYS